MQPVTKKIFWQNPYLQELETEISSIDKNRIQLAETIFFAFSGGQESDHGSIGGYQVISALKKEKQIIYTIDENHQLKMGDRVKILINWERRYRLMRLHFAAEIVLQVVYRILPNIEKTGAHIAHHKARIDFKTEEKISSMIGDIQKKVNHLLTKNFDIKTDWSDEREEKRFWKIDHFDQVSCGGTHVKNTSEIGPIYLKRVNPGKKMERIEIYIDQL